MEQNIQNYVILSNFNTPLGSLNVTLTADGRWRRRHLALYPISTSFTDTTTDDRELNRPQILIFPRQSAKTATARVRLTSSHGIESENGAAFYAYDEVERWKNALLPDNMGEQPLTFKLVKRNKITLFIKVSHVNYLYLIIPTTSGISEGEI